jgi:hypothetical protein
MHLFLENAPPATITHNGDSLSNFNVIGDGRCHGKNTKTDFKDFQVAHCRCHRRNCQHATSARARLYRGAISVIVFSLSGASNEFGLAADRSNNRRFVVTVKSNGRLITSVLDNLAIQMPGCMSEHRHHDGEADEKWHRTDQQETGDDKTPYHHRHRVGQKRSN